MPKPVILIVDDDVRFRNVLRMLFETDGWRVAEAPDGLAGSELARHVVPDVVLTDLSMPKMSGTEMARTLTLSREGSRPPIMAITSAASDMRAAAEESGLFVEVLAKSASARTILEAIRRVVRLPRGETSS